MKLKEEEREDEVSYRRYFAVTHALKVLRQRFPTKPGALQVKRTSVGIFNVMCS